MKYMEILTEAEVQEMLRHGATLVTVNRRLSRYAMDRYAQEQIRLGFSAWETPDVIPYAAWLERTLDESRTCLDPTGKKDLPVLLQPLQERLLWEKTVEEWALNEPLMRPEAAARLAEHAWRLCVEWRVPIDSGTYWTSTDPAVFSNWADVFERRCRSGNWLGRPYLADAVREAFSKEQVSGPNGLVFSGFDDFTPQLKELIEVLVSKKIRTCIQAFPTCAGKAFRTGCLDETVELETAARWARARFERNPAERIGIIINGLEQNRDIVCRIFDETLQPSTMISLSPVGKPAYNISLGRPLSGFPLVKNALVLLSMIHDYPEMETISNLLLSPYTRGAGKEMSRRGRVDALIRESKQPRMPMSIIFRFVGNLCPVLCRNLEAFERICLDVPDIQTPAAWCETISSLLDAFGWPGDRALDSEEYQSLEAWNDVLARLAGTGDVSPQLTFTGVFGILKRFLDESLFQPQTEDVNIQIMGLLEAAGEAFDSVWVTGLTSETWPSGATPNPFIPMPLQKKYGLSRATAERELTFSRQVTQRLTACADEIIVSHPLMSGESPVFPSTLIEHLPEVDPEGLVKTASDSGQALKTLNYRLLLSASGDMASFIDTAGPPLKKSETIRGGTSVIKYQAGCPFSAFVRYRLQAKPLDFPVSGLDAADRGNIVHKTLEFVWETLEDHQTLVAKTGEELSGIVCDAVSKAVSSMITHRPQALTGRFTGMEKRRLHDLIMQWLEFDRLRTPYQVLESERYMSLTIGDIKINTFADRIDRLDNGALVVIDYKTGDVSSKDWFTERIAEPQLPLYCLALDSIPAGIFFARVKKGDMKYVGVADDESIVNGVKAVADTGGLNEMFGSIKDMVEFWRSGLETIAGELAEGHAPVSPVSVYKTCRYCHFKPVCRVNELLESGLIGAQG